MCVCQYIYICVSTYLYVFVYMYRCELVYIQKYVYIHVHINTHTCRYGYVYMCTFTNMCTYKCIYTYSHMQICKKHTHGACQSCFCVYTHVGHQDNQTAQRRLLGGALSRHLWRRGNVRLRLGLPKVSRDNYGAC